MRALALAGGLMLLASTGCGGWEPLPYCSEAVPCPEGLVCHRSTHTCYRWRWDQGAPDASPDRGADLPGVDRGLDQELGPDDISGTYEKK